MLFDWGLGNYCITVGTAVPQLYWQSSTAGKGSGLLCPDALLDPCLDWDTTKLSLLVLLVPRECRLHSLRHLVEDGSSENDVHNTAEEHVPG